VIDPLTAFAAVKGGIAAGKQIHSMSKEIVGFFDSVDAAKKDHEKKKSSIFASSNEEAMDTWMRKQQAIDAELQLRELIVNTRGFSSYQELLALRRQVRLERREAARQAEIKEQERNEMILAGVGMILIFGGFISVLWWVGGKLGKW
jgi:hypothetical protein